MSNYINNKEFLETILQYQKTGSRQSHEKLGRYFKMVVEHLLFRPNFVNYTNDIKTDIISDACYNMCKYVDRFDQEKSENPFGYFTQISWYAAINVINKFHKQEKVMINFSNMDVLNSFDNSSDEFLDDDYMKVNSNFIIDEARRTSNYLIEAEEEIYLMRQRKEGK